MGAPLRRATGGGKAPVEVVPAGGAARAAAALGSPPERLLPATDGAGPSADPGAELERTPGPGPRGVTEGIQSGARAGPRRETGGRGGRARVPAQAAGVAAGTADDGGGASPDVASGVIAAAAPSHALELRRERPRASAAATHRTVSARAFAAVAVLSREGKG